MKFVIGFIVWGRSVRFRQLGYDPTALNKVKNGRARAPDVLLAKLLPYLII